MAEQEQLQKSTSTTVTDTQNSSEYLETRAFATIAKSQSDSSEQPTPPNLQKKSGIGHSFANLIIQAPPASVIQPKLTIGQPGDKYEQEADSVAAQVVQKINSPAVSSKNKSVQRQQASEEEELQMKPMADVIQRVKTSQEEEELQMKSAADSGKNASTDLETSINQARGGGQSLNDSIRQPMEQAFGADFSGVKVHTDGKSDQLNQSIQAKAFTTGKDIFFRQGEYNPGNKGGQELLAHELTHVVQQNSGSVQRSQPVQMKTVENDNLIQQKSLNSSQSLASTKPITYTQAISLQAAFETAYVNDTAQLHNINSQEKDAGTISGGKKLKSGDAIEADESDSKASGAWIGAKAEGKEGYIRRSKIVFKRNLEAITNPEYESDFIENGEEITDSFGGGFDDISGGMEQGLLKENDSGTLNDLDGKSTKIEGGKTGLDIVSGSGDTLTGLLGMVGNARQIGRDKTAWENLESGYGFLQSGSKATSGATKIVDSIAKASGNKDGVGKSDIAGKWTGAIADGLGAVKDAALGIIGIYKLYKSQSDEKGKDTLVTLNSFTNAAANAAKVAKSAYDIIGNGIPMSLIYTIPALSIGVSAINLLIRLWDALKAGDFKTNMSEAANPLRDELASKLGEPVPTEKNIGSSKLFDKDRRGTFPNYKTYFRTKKQVRDAVKTIAAFAQTESGIAEANLQSVPLKYIGPKTKEEYEQPLTESHDNIKNNIDSTSLDQAIKDKLKTSIGTPKTIEEFREITVYPLKELDQKIDTYEYIDKMSEINQKRQTSGWTDVTLELVSMAGDITTIAVGATGIGAAIGQGVKASTAGYKVAHGSAKFVQKLYRNRGDGSDKKSSKNKHKEYTEHAKFIYHQIAALSPSNPPTNQDKNKEKQLETYIRATGVNYGMWLSVKYNPQTQVEMLVEAMKQR